MEDAVEAGAPPVRPGQGEDGTQVIEGDVALGERTHQTSFLEGGPLLLQGPCAAQVSLKIHEFRGHVLISSHHISQSFTKRILKYS